MIPYPHGTHELEVREQIIIIRAYDAWNMEHAAVYFQELQAVVRTLPFDEWGGLADFRAFKGSPPEVVRFFNETVIPWSIENGQVARAQLINDTIMKHLAAKAAQENASLPTAVFGTELEAFSWFREQGLVV